MNLKNCTLIICMIIAATSCRNEKKIEKQETNDLKTKISTHTLSMKINGVLWEAEYEIFGAFHPKGYNKAIIMSGNKGAKGKEEQVFTLNLFNTEGPGIFNIKTGNADYNVVQLANLSEQSFLYGSLMGFDMKVTVTKTNSNPTLVEAFFEGELTGNASDKIKITEGKFFYSE